MNDLQIFKNDDFGAIRTAVDENGNPWLALTDICKVLDIGNPSQLKTRLREDGVITNEVGVQTGIRADGTPAMQTVRMTFINEQNFYKCIFQSRKPEAEMFADWVTGEVLPSIRKTGSYQIASAMPSQALLEKQIEAQLLQARANVSEQFQKLLAVDTLSKKYRDILICKNAEILCGEAVLPLPKSEQKTYTATEIGKMFGISKQRVGTLAKQYGMKIPEFGEWYRDKSPYSSKEVDAFRYNDKAIEKFHELLG